MSVRTPLVLVALGLMACPVANPPGEPMGTYRMSTGEAARACELAEVSPASGVSDTLSFDAVLSRNPEGTEAWLTLAGHTRPASFDGQLFTSVAAASRIFTECSACRTRLVETFRVAVLSRSQAAVLSDQCPPDALDGGLPQPNDAGIVGPGQTALGFDAVRLCGELTTELVADGLPDGGPCEPRCHSCTARYALRGDRK
jgi:hypothetical protein